jgi:argininosuccinate lyase
VGGLIRRIEAEHCELHELPFAAFAEAHPLFAEDVFGALKAAHSLEQREVEGGTGPRAVHTQLETARAAIRF